MSMPAVSKHLRVLERAGLIARGREAQWRPCRIEARPAQGRRRMARTLPSRLGGAARSARRLSAGTETEGEKNMAVSSVANSDTFKIDDAVGSRDRPHAPVRCAAAARVRRDDEAGTCQALVGMPRTRATRCRSAKSICASAAPGASSAAARRANTAFYGVYREIDAARAAGLHRDLRSVPRCRIGRDLGVHRRGRENAPDRHGALSVAGGARHRCSRPAWRKAPRSATTGSRIWSASCSSARRLGRGRSLDRPLPLRAHRPSLTASRRRGTIDPGASAPSASCRRRR